MNMETIHLSLMPEEMAATSQGHGFKVYLASLSILQLNHSPTCVIECSKLFWNENMGWTAYR